MYTPMKKISSFLIIFTYWIILMLSGFEVAVAGKRFISTHPCSDTGNVCRKRCIKTNGGKGDLEEIAREILEGAQ